MRAHIAMLAALALLSSTAVAETGQHVEDFTTTAYRDAAHTSALWDTRAGELRLYGREIVQADLLLMGDNPRDVDVAGDFAFIANGDEGLLVVDIGNPAALSIVGSWTGVFGPAGALDVEGDLLYMSAAGGPGSELIVIDVSTPSAPVKISSIQIYGDPYGLAVSGDFVFIAAGSTGRLQVVEVTDPAHPILRNGVACGDARDVAIAGDLAYVADFDGNLRVVDITTPASSALISTTPVLGNPCGISLEGRVACLAADDDGGLQMVDVTNPLAPVACGGYEYCFAGDVAVSGHYAYVGDVEDGVIAFDIRGMDLPRLMRRSSPIVSVSRLLVRGAYAYAIDTYTGALRTFRIADPVGLSTAGDLSLSAPSYDVAVDGRYAYVAGGGDGLHVIDISEPTDPVLLDSDDVSGSAYCVATMGEHVLLGTWYAGTYVYDVGDPSHIVQVDHLDTPLYVYDIAIHGDYAYIAARSDGLRVLDVHDPSSISVVGSYTPTGQTYGVAVAGDRAYIVGSLGFTVCDITSPTAPAPLGTVGVSGEDIALDGDHAYVAAGTFGLRVVDITSSSSPTLATSRATADYAANVTVAGDYAFVTDTEGGMYVFDIRNPSSPVVYDSETPHSIFVSGVDISGDYSVWVGDEGIELMTSFERLVDTAGDVGQSTTILAPPDDVLRVRVTTLATGTLEWRVSADGGAHWQLVPTGVWQDLLDPGRDLRWQATLVYDTLGLNPTCRQLTVEWETPTVGVGDPLDASAFACGNARPNPFSSRLSISYALETDAGVRITIHDLTGRLVRVLREGEIEGAGPHEAVWDGLDRNGARVPAGTYYYRLQAGNHRASGTITRIE